MSTSLHLFAFVFRALRGSGLCIRAYLCVRAMYIYAIVRTWILACVLGTDCWSFAHVRT